MIFPYFDVIESIEKHSELGKICLFLQDDFKKLEFTR